MTNIKTFDPNSFTMSNVAIEHFKNNSSLGIRFSIKASSGCSGYNYVMDFVDNCVDEDFVFNFEDLKVYIDPQSFTYLKGTTVDFVTEGVNEEVKFLNPNVKAICGCGESFEIDA